MPAEPDVIDLDGPDRRTGGSGDTTAERFSARRRTILRLVAAFVVGAMLGGVGVNGLRDAREQRERSSAVTLVALPASVGSGGTDGPGILQLDGQLAVINTGPASITVRTVTAQRPGVLIRDTGRSGQIRPGGTAWIDVRARIECAVETGSEPLPMRFWVETDDRKVREVTYPVALVGSVWHRAADQPCQHLRNR